MGIKKGFTANDFKESPDEYWHPRIDEAYEKVGLEKVDEHEWFEQDYSFDTLLVLRDPDAKVFYNLSSAGCSCCSCPAPFEEYDSEASLGDPMTAIESVAQVLKEWKARIPDAEETYMREPYSPADLIGRILDADKSA